MKCLQLTAQHKLNRLEVLEPVDDDGADVSLKVKYCGICRTDAKMWDKGQRDLLLPRILGHEFCGYDSCNRLFIVWPAKSCGTCFQCLSGNENLCSHIEILGFHRDGGMAEFSVVPEDSLICVPGDLEPALSIFAEPMACGINALQQLDGSGKLKECEFRRTGGGNLLIFGGGTCGLLIALAAKEYGLTPFVVEKNDKKGAKCEPFKTISGIETGADIPVDRKFDYVINAAASSDTLFSGIRSLCAGGKFVLFSGLNRDFQFSAEILNELHYRQLTLVGAYGCTKRQMIEAVEIITKNQNAVKTLIEDFIKLDDVEKTMPAVLSGNKLRYIIKFQ
jgi:threonine dehydrogenase-like Zn-dependent dehydrogenase